MVEIPKATLVERIRSRSGPEAADSANDELPDKHDLDSAGTISNPTSYARSLAEDRHPRARRLEKASETLVHTMLLLRTA